MMRRRLYVFFFNDTATTEIYTLSLHDALPIYPCGCQGVSSWSAGARSSRSTSAPLASRATAARSKVSAPRATADRKSTRLNSSHANISYAVFCLKKKNMSHPSHLRLLDAHLLL